MPYVNITLDVGAAINAYKTLWIQPELFRNIVIHFGGFHFMKENFQVIGNLITGSGWEDVVFQSGISSSGSLMAVLTGSHYNRAWIHHSIVAEAMERLLLPRYVYDITHNRCENKLEMLSCDPDDVMTEDLRGDFQEASILHERYRENIRNGSLGKTAKFWMIYLDFILMQHCIHNAIQENDFSMRLSGWEYFVPFYFAFSKTNYARYGTYYVELMKSIDIKCPGLKNMLKAKGLSVQSQDRYPVRTLVDQRGEQTINREAKMTGGLKFFNTKEEIVLKWCLNRSDQAKNTKALEDLCGLGTDTGIYNQHAHRKS